MFPTMIVADSLPAVDITKNGGFLSADKGQKSYPLCPVPSSADLSPEVASPESLVDGLSLFMQSPRLHFSCERPSNVV